MLNFYCDKVPITVLLGGIELFFVICTILKQQHLREGNQNIKIFSLYFIFQLL